MFISHIIYKGANVNFHKKRNLTTSHVTTIFDWTSKSSTKMLFPTSNSPLDIHLETFYILLIFIYKI